MMLVAWTVLNVFAWVDYMFAMEGENINVHLTDNVGMNI